MKNTIIWTIIAITASVVLIVIVVKATPSNGSDAQSGAYTSNGKLTVEEKSYDFGTISIAAGQVRHSFKLSNASSESVVIEKLYTSCMCTKATLTYADEQSGPFGMPSHGAIPKINQEILSNTDAVVEVEFDPAAHGPAGVGKISRKAIMDNNAGLPIELNFTAFVTP